MAPLGFSSKKEAPSAAPPPSEPPPPPYVDGATKPSSSSGSRPPPAGLRTPCSTTSKFPEASLLGTPPFQDVGGEPVYVCSAINGDSVHPCKAAPHLDPPVRLPWGGGEVLHQGRYDILPITEQMEWVPTSHGNVPAGRRPVEGGYEADGKHLWHAAATLPANITSGRTITLPGKTGTHLGGANFAFDAREIVLRDSYTILCWR